MKEEHKKILWEYIQAVSIIFLIVLFIVFFTDLGKHNNKYIYDYDDSNCTIQRNECKFLATQKICFSAVTIRKYDYNIDNLICECDLNNCYL